MLAAPESYNAIKTGLADAIREVNRFVEDGYIEIDPGKCDKRKETRNIIFLVDAGATTQIILSKNIFICFTIPNF